MAPVGCAVAPPISGLLSIEGIPVRGLVDTGASVTCLGFAIWWRYRAQWGALKPFTSAVHSAHGKPLHIAGNTEHLDIQWGEARGRASFIIIVGLESPPCLIGMDIMRPLRVSIDVTEGTATPAQPDPQTIHLNAAQTQPPQESSSPTSGNHGVRSFSPHTEGGHKPSVSVTATGQVANRGGERDPPSSHFQACPIPWISSRYGLTSCFTQIGSPSHG